jgi:hypothetical protein
MVRKCANRGCSATRRHQEGRLFRLDIGFGHRAAGDERKTEYIWLCAPCAARMHPEVQCTGNSVVLRLAENLSTHVVHTQCSISTGELKWRLLRRRLLAPFF